MITVKCIGINTVDQTNGDARQFTETATFRVQKSDGSPATAGSMTLIITDPARKGTYVNGESYAFDPAVLPAAPAKAGE